MTRWMILLALAGCAPVADVAPAPERLEISYETERCFGACPAYRVTVSSPGQTGVFEGKHYTAAQGRRDFTYTAAQFAAFRDALRPARSAEPGAYQPGGAHCRLMATDHPGVAVTFTEGARAPVTFRYYYGCHDPENASLAEALRKAPDALPIAALIGSR